MTNATTPYSIVVVSYNTLEMTEACIRSVLTEAQSNDFELIVIDNASNDGSADMIEKEFAHQVRLIRSPHNLGFAKANNVAAEEATGELLLLLNPDTVVLDHAIDCLVEFAAEHDDADVWGGRTVFADGSLNATSCWRFMSLWSVFAQAIGLSALLRQSDIFNAEAYGGWKRDHVREVDFITGCFLLIRRGLWQRLGGFDESFFMYAEEADLCYRARKLGAQPLFTPEATIIHFGGASESVLSGKIERLFSGKITFMKKHWPVPKRIVGANLFKLYTLVRICGYSLAYLLRRSERHRVATREWSKVWRTRHKWSEGYSMQHGTDPC